MLKRVRIQNYKCLRDVDVDLSPLTVLIGPNDSGKTSFLTCLKLLGDLANPSDPNQQEGKKVADELRHNLWRLNQGLQVAIEVIAHHPVEFSLSIRVGPEWSGLVQRLTIGSMESLKLEPSKSNPQQTVKIKFRDREIQAFVNQSLLLQVLRTSLTTSDDDLKQIQQELKISEPYHFSPTEMRKPSEAKASPVLSSRGENLAAVLNSMLTGADRAAVNELEQSLNRAIPTLRGLSTPPKDNNGALRLIEFAMSGPERPPLTIPSDEVSDGALFLTAFLALIHTQSTQVLLIEEPENGLHPSRLQTVIELMRKVTTGELGYSPRQVILSTHSPLLLNLVAPSEVRIFRRGEDGATNVVCMDQWPDIDRLTKEFATGELWYLFGEEELSRGAAK